MPLKIFPLSVNREPLDLAWWRWCAFWRAVTHISCCNHSKINDSFWSHYFLKLSLYVFVVYTRVYHSHRVFVVCTSLSHCVCLSCAHMSLSHCVCLSCANVSLSLSLIVCICHVHVCVSPSLCVCCVRVHVCVVLLRQSLSVDSGVRLVARESLRYSSVPTPHPALC